MPCQSAAPHSSETCSTKRVVPTSLRIRSKSSISATTVEVLILTLSVGSSAVSVVVYSKYGGTEITIDGDDLLILPARDILAIVK